MQCGGNGRVLILETNLLKEAELYTAFLKTATIFCLFIFAYFQTADSYSY